MRTATALLFLMLSAPAFAGETYSFVLQKQGEIMETFRKGRVVVDGSRYRVELDEPGDMELPFDVLVSTDGGRSEVGLFPGLRTYYHLKEPCRTGKSNLFKLLPTLDKPSIQNLQVHVTEAPELEAVSGIPTRRHEIRLSYDISVAVYKEKEKMKGRIAMEATYWIAEGPERTVPVLLRPTLTTDIPEVDEQLREPLSKLRGLPVRQRVTVTADSAGISRRSTTFELTLGGLEQATPAADAFEIPRGFREKEPEISTPGKMPDSR